MLARLLRFLLAIQALAGMALGYLLHRWVQAPLWGMVAWALALPLAATLVLTLESARRSRAPGTPISLWWAAAWGEFLAGARIFLLRQPWTRGTPTMLPATATPQRLPVVLVHGYLCNHRIWDDVAADLRAQGHAVLAVNLEPLFTSIDDYAPIVETAVAKLLQATGARQVVLVGHSMGGLAIRAWMRAHGTARVARVLTLGTPHAGTQVEPRTRTPNGRQMLWHSAWLAALLAAESPDTRALIHIALTPQDNIVFPQREQVLPQVPVTEFPGIGHLQMCLDAQVRAWVLHTMPEHTP
jgi:pimeloyl-ACP methyl ester carboxylesterase